MVEPIIPDKEFDAAIPPIAPEDDPALQQPLESIDSFEASLDAHKIPKTNDLSASSGASGVAADGTDMRLSQPAITPVAEPMHTRDAELMMPLSRLEDFKVEAPTLAENRVDGKVVEVAYAVRIQGLETIKDDTSVDIGKMFDGFSALRDGKGRAANIAQLNSRLGEDVLLLKKLLAAQGWFNAAVNPKVERAGTADGLPLTAVLAVVPGKRFAFGALTIKADPTIPADLIVRNLALVPGELIIAERVIGAEAQVALALPQNGYPFAEVRARDVLLDEDTGRGDYTLPVTVGQRGRYGDIVSSGKLAFGDAHVAKLARFKRGDLYDSRQVDDLRQALIATGLFNAVGVEPVATGQSAGDGTEFVTLGVKQEAGPPRVIAATAGYATGQGFRAEASWTHRNLFPPEGALIASGVAGTLEQGAALTFRRSNAGQRDRNLELAADLHHSQYSAFSAYTGRLSARVSYESTPLWQKRLTYAYGGQVLGTNESIFDPALGLRVRRTYAIGGLIGQLGFDTTDSLLDPTRGFRITALIEPEAALRKGVTPYVRARLDGSTYYGLGRSIVVAGRARISMIQGAALNDLAPSRRIYAGGGGSVRGFAYQRVGPQDNLGNPIGGRSAVEGAAEVRYRFGDYGIVAFADIGQVYSSQQPRFTNLRAGLGVGARIYTNFGPVRIDLATPLGRRPGESRINVYVSIGQSF